VAYCVATEGGKVGVGAEGCGDVVDQGAYVSAAGAGDLEGGGALLHVRARHGEGVYLHGAGLALYGEAAAVELVEPDALELQGRGHRGGLQKVTYELG
jgi:hypothetical protein